MLFDFLDEKVPRRYKDKLQDVEYLVLHDIEKKGIKLEKNELNRILDVLFEYRVID